MTLDLIQTVAFAGVILFAGYGLKKLIPPLARYNIPAPVAGGLPGWRDDRDSSGRGSDRCVSAARRVVEMAPRAAVTRR
jgi:hypothetical protein